MVGEDEDIPENVFSDLTIGSDLSEKKRRTHGEDSSGGCAGRLAQTRKQQGTRRAYRDLEGVPGKPSRLRLAAKSYGHDKGAAVMKSRVRGSRKETWAHCLQPTASC